MSIVIIELVYNKIIYKPLLDSFPFWTNEVRIQRSWEPIGYQRGS